MTPTLARAIRASYKLFPREPATVRIHRPRRPWWSTFIPLTSSAWSAEWEKV